MLGFMPFNMFVIIRQNSNKGKMSITQIACVHAKDL